MPGAVSCCGRMWQFAKPSLLSKPLNSLLVRVEQNSTNPFNKFSYQSISSIINHQSSKFERVSTVQYTSLHLSSSKKHIQLVIKIHKHQKTHSRYHLKYSGLLFLFTTGGGPSSSGYGSGAPGGGLANALPGGGLEVRRGEILNAGCSDSGGGILPLPSWRGVLGGRGGGSKVSRGDSWYECGRWVENCSLELRPGETSSPECRGGRPLVETG